MYYSPFLLEHLSLCGAPLVIPTLLTPLSMMAQFIGEVPSESSSYSSSETSTGSDLDIPAVKLKPDKSNETDPLPKVKDIGKETAGISEKKQKIGKGNQKAGTRDSTKTKKQQQGKINPEKAVWLVKKLIQKHKNYFTKDKRRLNDLLKCVSSSARSYKDLHKKLSKKSNSN